ncbi:uncharacterized protein [Neodiprion pinetum]|uniref:uncharacterized protein isoform X1 n=1 Tax=Neodiprion pinetum TaxID=441929 RepID=UPI001EDFD88F|nr:uncharacterized protein LOC124214105 isoform X1 [Neodiprion pinetum]
MQLAATPRPHPPPVPPRPSRQVVAEALKRSPRPPCPTRQAPPPPDTKPWRAGRTVVYESATSPTSVRSAEDDRQQRDERAANPRDQNLQRLGGGKAVTPATSERGDGKSRGTIQQPLKRPAPIHVARTGNGGGSSSSESEKSAAPKFKNQRHIQVVNGAVVFEAQNTQVRVPRSESKESRPEDADEALKESAEMDAAKNVTTVDDKREEVVEGPRRSSSSTISSGDDCATVVVVDDQPESRRVAFDDRVNIQHEDWLEAGVRYSSTKITLSGDEVNDEGVALTESTEDRINGLGYFDEDEEMMITAFDFTSIKEKIAMSTLQGLPPLPRSLSGFNLSTNRDGNEPPPPPARSSSRPQRGARTSPGVGGRPSPQGRQLTTLDTQLAKLRREMFGLRQLDLSLLSQLWSLNESIQEFRQLLQEQDDRAPSPSPSSEEGDDTSYGSHPPPHPRRPPPVSHHHRAPRPPPRNDSPSSEEYGAV